MNKNEIKSIFREIELTKKTLRDEIAKIEADATRSGEYKLQQKFIAREKAEAELKRIRERAGELDLKTQKEFDYSNPELLDALRFIELAKDSVNKDAVQTMINKLADHPKELAFLRDVFASNRKHEYAAMVNEAVNIHEVKANFPQRLDDAIYYATDGNPEKEVSFADIEAELDAMTE